MQRRVFVTVAALAAAFVLGSAIAHAQGVTAEIGFAFVAAGKDMPAGKYSVRATQPGILEIRGPSGTASSVMVITRLGRHDNDVEAEFVFDKIDGKLCLSEVWMPGTDGFLLLATKGQHEHAVVGGSNPRK